MSIETDEEIRKWKLLRYEKQKRIKLKLRDKDKAKQLAEALRNMYLSQGFDDETFRVEAANAMGAEYGETYWENLFIRALAPPSTALIEWICEFANEDPMPFILLKKLAYMSDNTMEKVYKTKELNVD